MCQSGTNRNPWVGSNPQPPRPQNREVANGIGDRRLSTSRVIVERADHHRGDDRVRLTMAEFPPTGLTLNFLDWCPLQLQFVGFKVFFENDLLL